MGLVATCAFLLGCIDGTVEKPPPPEIASYTVVLKDQFGSISADNLQVAVAEATVSMTRLMPICGWDRLPMESCSGIDSCLIRPCDILETLVSIVDFVTRFVDAIDRAYEAIGEPPPGSYVSFADGFGTVDRLCRGHDALPKRPESGAIKLNFGFSDAGLDGVLWGAISDCKYKSAWGEITLDGDVIVGSHKSGDLGPGDLMVVLDTTWTGNQQDGASRDVLLLDSATDTTFTTLNESQVLFFYSPTGVGFVDEAGELKCDFDAQECYRADGEVLTW